MPERPDPWPDQIHLRGGGCSVVLDVSGRQLPAVAHWGADLGDLDAMVLAEIAAGQVPPPARAGLDRPVRTCLLPQPSIGWSGRPGLRGARASSGTDWSPAFRLVGVEQASGGSNGGHIVTEAICASAGLALRTELRLSPHGVLRARHTVRNEADEPYALDWLAPVLPVPARASELLDLTGRWGRERAPQRHPFGFGAWLRESRRGRTGHDAPLLLVAGTPGFGFGHGEVWAAHVAWSGDHVWWAERQVSGVSVLAGTELLSPGEVTLGHGESYTSPWLYAAWGEQGLDDVSSRFHAFLRDRPSHPDSRRPRPVVLNTWEAVYFDQDLDRLRVLADRAAEVGVERFVLDDGWFRHRRDDTAGLGDWYVDETVWPEGLHPLVDHVRGLGMQFGLWVEPEMVNPDSDLYRAHPEWVLGVPAHPPMTARHQLVLDLARPEAYAYVRDRLEALLAEYDIGYLKWDHNRDLVEAAHLGGRAGVHGQTEAVYRLLDELRARHPGLEIESCSSGGARVDLGILERTDRVWASDTNDALERQAIQRWTSLLLPLELIGAHVGPPMSHTTGRAQDLAFRAVTALFGHFGIEWDIAAIDDGERGRLAGWIALYKRLRPLLHTGRLVRVDSPDPGLLAHGVVAADGSEAVYALVRVATSAETVPPLVPLPGLRAGGLYDVRPLLSEPPNGEVDDVRPADTEPPALAPTRLTGLALERIGVRPPVMNPERATLVRVTLVEDGR